MTIDCVFAGCSGRKETNKNMSEVWKVTVAPPHVWFECLEVSLQQQPAQVSTQQGDPRQLPPNKDNENPHAIAE